MARKTLAVLVLVAMAHFWVEPVLAGRGGGVRYGGHHGGAGGPGGPGGRGGPGGPGRHGPGPSPRHGMHHGVHHGFHAAHFHGFHVGFHPRPLFWHPVGFFIVALTTAAIVVSINNRQYHYDEGVYYEESSGGYKAVSAPIGAKIPELPDDTQTIVVGTSRRPTN